MLPKLLLWVVGCVIFPLSAHSQILASKGTLDFLFARNVKSVNEFVNRFNGIESHPDIPDDALSRRNNILALINPEIDTGGLKKDKFKNLVITFADDAAAWNGRLDIGSENFFAELPCNFRYGSKPFGATLLLRRENSDKGNPRWAIAGVKGLREAGFYSDLFVGISPVDHEMEFVGLDDLFNINRNLVSSMKSQYRPVDELSMFLGLAQNPNFKFINSRKLRLHFLDVPGYIFSVCQSDNKEDLGSWMIDRIGIASDFDKLGYINNLFGLK